MSEPMPRADVRAPAKPLRCDLVRLSVTADPCPNITLRILGLLAQRSILPATIAQTARPRSLTLELVFAAPDLHQAAIVQAKVEQLVGVWRVRLARVR